MSQGSFLPQGESAALRGSAIFEKKTQPAQPGLTLNRLTSPAIRAGALSFLVLLALCLPQATRAANWVYTGSLTSERTQHTATLLNDGRVLAVGGFGVLYSETYNPTSGAWSSTGYVYAMRARHTATLLADGRVLVAGGFAGSVLATAQLFNPATNAWSDTGSLNAARGDHTATRLNDGKVLVAGGRVNVGMTGGDLDSAELYDPASGKWTTVGPLTMPRGDHTATLLKNGKVLVAGGEKDSGTPALASAEIFDPVTKTWAATPRTMKTPRSRHTATLLPDGKVMVAGGYTSTAELYDPAQETWSDTGSLSMYLFSHTAVLLANNLVLVAGGRTWAAVVTNSELFDPLAGTWAATGSLNLGRYSHTATRLKDGRVLAAGGSVYGSGKTATAELYTPAGPQPKSNPAINLLLMQ